MWRQGLTKKANCVGVEALARSLLLGFAAGALTFGTRLLIRKYLLVGPLYGVLIGGVFLAVSVLITAVLVPAAHAEEPTVPEVPFSLSEWYSELYVFTVSFTLNETTYTLSK